ncbi:FMRF-Like Peptide [Caenorhabditis elegans]|uniref:FMRF-Like Peptide n=1 Tax=Caenorhabditis elegans TaxID=6239 RepID=Q9XWZ5_CAEEL|nr:FMRF-Like Peptide [Caenorhabditis elegans]CAA21486.1 FMRF-Like Peptide [Caenorhabditis elegans]|eukprot:NP_505822.1 Uncharacterized protein CELE_Y42A5A.3 [Caenorhabditis elegans]
MPIYFICFLILLVVQGSHANSVLSRYFNEEDGVPLARHPLEDARVSDADVGMKSDLFIGTFGGRPIVTRQENTFIDQDGVPVPMLPYQKTYRNSDHLSARSKFMDRSRGFLTPV